MKNLLFLFSFVILFAQNLYSFEYSSGVSVDFGVPISISAMEGRPKCIGCFREISLSFQSGVTFKNKIKLSDSLDLNIDFSYNGTFASFEEKNGFIHLLGFSITLNKNFGDFFIGGGIWNEQSISQSNDIPKDFIRIPPFFFLLSIDLGYYFSDNLGLLLSNKIFKSIYAEGNYKGYLLTDFSIFYYF